MKLTNKQLQNFIGRIKLKRENMPIYRDQLANMLKNLETKIRDDERTGAKVTRTLIAGSWKKGTILRRTGEHPIDIDLVLFIEGDDNLKQDVEKLHDFIVEYLSEIYPTKDITRDIDAEGHTKSIKIKFSGTGLEVDIVPVIPMPDLEGYVWQPQRGGGGTYITSVDGQIEFARSFKEPNSSYTSIVRALKWWRQYQEIDKSQLSSFAIELIVSHLERTRGIETNIEEGIIRVFEYLSSGDLSKISFREAINNIPSYSSPIFIGDPTNNENNVSKKMDQIGWDEIVSHAEKAFETLSIAQSTNAEGQTVEEWKNVFGPKFNIKEEE